MLVELAVLDLANDSLRSLLLAFLFCPESVPNLTAVFFWRNLHFALPFDCRLLLWLLKALLKEVAFDAFPCNNLLVVFRVRQSFILVGVEFAVPKVTRLANLPFQRVVMLQLAGQPFLCFFVAAAVRNKALLGGWLLKALDYGVVAHWLARLVRLPLLFLLQVALLFKQPALFFFSDIKFGACTVRAVPAGLWGWSLNCAEWLVLYLWLDLRLGRSWPGCLHS